MKTILLILLFAIQLNVQSQEHIKEKFLSDTSNYTAYIGTKYNSKIQIFNSNYIPYIVGSSTIPGYKIEIRICPNDDKAILSNGKHIAGISCILSEKLKYIGGSLIFGDNKTIITDISVVPIGESEAKFTVIGKDFSMNFTLKNGKILKFENDYVIFNTKNKGIWLIKKKV